MKRPRVKAYLALLTTLILLAGSLGAVGTAQARVTGTTAVVNTVLLPQPGAISSDCLLGDGKQIILLGELEAWESVEAEFTLETTRDISGQLVWYTNSGVPVETEVDFWMEEGEGSLSEDHLLEMEAGAKAIVTLTITAVEEILRAQTVDVQVICEDLLGIFRVELIPDQAETEPTEPSEPEETQPSEPEETIPPELDQPVDPIDPIAPSEPEHTTHSQEPDVEVVTDEPGTEAPTDPSDPTEPADPEPSDPTEPENPETTPTDPSEPPESPEAAVELAALREFELTGLLPLKLSASGDADLLRLGLADGEPLPEFTRYSTDGGESWYLLYFGGYIIIEEPLSQEEQDHLFLMDFSRTEMETDVPVMLEAEATLDGAYTGIAYAEILPREAQRDTEAVRILTAPSQEELAEMAAFLMPGEEEPEPTVPAETEPAEQVTESSAPVEETEPTVIHETEPSEPETSEWTDPDPTEETAPSEPEETEPTPSGETEPTERNLPTEPEQLQPSEPEIPEEPTEPEPEAGLSEGYFFRIPLPLGWADCQEIRFQAELLTQQEEQMVYMPVEWNPQQLNAVVDETSGSLIVYLGGTTPTAGTYRLTLECIFEDICFEQMQMTFFINYSTRSDARNDEVPNNE